MFLIKFQEYFKKIYSCSGALKDIQFAESIKFFELYSYNSLSLIL